MFKVKVKLYIMGYNKENAEDSHGEDSNGEDG